jgi:hypothetical protein
MMKMKNLILLILLLLRSICAAENELVDAESKKHYLFHLFQTPTNATSLSEIYPSICQTNNLLEQYIKEAIALNDEEINRQLIGYLSNWAQPFAAQWPFDKIDSAKLDQLKTIESLKPFLVSQLYASKPHYAIYLALSIIYKDDKNIIDKLIEEGKKNNLLLQKVLSAFWQSGHYDLRIESLVLRAISSNSVVLCSAATAFLNERPLDSALPHLIRQMQHSVSELEFNGIMADSEYFYVPSDLQAAINDGFAAAGVGRAEFEDGWRSEIITAILKYDKNDLAVFAEEILNSKNIVAFGPKSQGPYDALVGVLKDVDSDHNGSKKYGVEQEGAP